MGKLRKSCVTWPLEVTANDYLREIVMEGNGYLFKNNATNSKKYLCFFNQPILISVICYFANQ